MLLVALMELVCVKKDEQEIIVKQKHVNLSAALMEDALKMELVNGKQNQDIILLTLILIN